MVSFNFFGSDFFFRIQRAAVEFMIIIVKLISWFHNSTLQEFSNSISHRIYTWLCLIIVKKTATIQDVAVAEEAVVNLRIVGGRHWLKETELFLLRLVSAYLKYCLTNFKSVYLQGLHSLRVHISRVYFSSESSHSWRTSITQRNGAVLAASDN